MEAVRGHSETDGAGCASPVADPFAGLPRGYYACVVADAGTEFVTRSVKGITDRSPQRKYTTMPLAQIAALPVEDIVADDAHLFFWTTGPLLAIGAHIPIMRAWGFEPRAMAFTWVKTRKHADLACLDAATSFHMGSGYTTRKNAEFCILWRRGSPRRIRADVRELIVSPRQEHSRKPAETWDRVKAYCAGPYLELFSREVTPGVESWGDQVGKFGGGNA